MKKYVVNESYFEEINTPNQAYILGLLYADGCVSLRPKRQSCLQLSLEKTDRNMLVKILNKMESTHKVLESNIKYPALVIGSNKLCSDLIKLGCVPSKSMILEWPTENQVPAWLISHFIRGYFDGDGSVWKSQTGRHKNSQFLISMVGTLSTCQGISNVLNEDLGFKIQNIKKDRSIYRYIFCGNKKVKLFYNYIYQDAELFLERKKTKMAEVFNVIPYALSS